MKKQLYLYIKAFSDLGTRMDTIVLSSLIYTLTGSAGWLSASLGAAVLGGLLSSFYSGVLADRFDRQKIMIFSDISRAVCILLLIPFHSPIMILAVRFFNGFMTSFFDVSFQSEVPQIYKEKHLFDINALVSRLSAISMVVGFIGGGVVADMIGFRSVLVLDCITFLASAFVISRLTWEKSITQAKQSLLDSMKRVATDFQEVKQYVSIQSLLLLVFVVYLIDTFGAGSHNLGIPILAAQVWPLKSTLLYGLIWGIWAIGNVLATYLLPKYQWIKTHIITFYFVTTILMSTGFICILSSQAIPAIFVSSFFTGIFDACSVTTFTIIMQFSDNQIRGRLFGISTLLNRTGFLIGFVVAPMLLARMNLPHMVWIFHGTVITTTLVALILTKTVLVNKIKQSHNWVRT